MTLTATLLRLSNFRTPLLRTLVPSLALAYGIQTAVAIPSIAFQSERFYDLSGSLTYLSCTALSLYLPVLRARAGIGAEKVAEGAEKLVGAGGGGGMMGLINWRQAAVSLAVSIWATRLGTFLFQRILSDGTDSRFDKIRNQPLKFYTAFFLQATWVSLCALPIFALNSVPRAAFASLPPLLLTDALGLSLYAFGIAFEATADRQKSAWVAEKKEKKHDEDFLTRGLWGKSRHPNYFGEICLWSGIAVASGGVLARAPALAAMGVGRAVALGMAGVSPIFTAFLLTQVSGIPLSENKYDKKYGDREDYKRWKRETPVLIPKIF